jgi:thiamine biosynthesis lipoprotein
MTAVGPTVDRARTLHVEQCMGTVFTIDIRDPGSWDAAIAEVVAWLHRVDAVFSTYKAGSAISRLRRGEIDVADCDADVAVVLDLCVTVQAETNGYFTAAWDGSVDPTGLVKGWAIERASEILRRRGSSNHSVNGGGDIQLAGESAPGEPWRVGIVDPLNSARVLTVVTGRDFAVATSGIAERGKHIVDPVGNVSPAELASVTVVGPSLTRADAYATAAFAMGPDASAWLESVAGHEGLVVFAGGGTTDTSGFARYELPGSFMQSEEDPSTLGSAPNQQARSSS